MIASRVRCAPVRCTSCGRKDGNLASGIVVNAIGCTGACLHWAIHAIDNPPISQDYGWSGHWEEWEISDEDCTCVELILSDVNPHGCSMLINARMMNDESVMPFDASVNEPPMYVTEWIDLLRRRYKQCLDAATPEFIVANYPRLLGIYNIICTIHHQLSELPTRILTLKVAMCADASLQVSTSTMSGQVIYEETVGTAAVIGDHVSRVLTLDELPFRVGSDLNLYTREEFDAHYGEERGGNKWEWASPLNPSTSTFVSEDGQLLSEGMDALFLTSLVVVQPTGETNQTSICVCLY